MINKMHRQLAWGLIIGIVFTCFIGQAVKVEANDIIAVERNKVWKINFSNKVKLDESTKGQISVIDREGKKVNTSLALSEDSKAILVKPPLNQYDEGEIYTLKIETNIYSSLNNKLKSSKEKRFIIKASDRYSEAIKIKEGDSITAENGKEYILDRLDKLKDGEGNDVVDSNWKASVYLLKKTKSPKVYIQNDEGAGELVIPIKLNGWFGVYIGYVTGTEEFKVKITGKEENVKIIEKKNEKEYLKETFAFAADFKNDNISIDDIEGKKARIAYVKLVGLTEEQIKLYQSYNEYRTYTRVIYNNDGFTDFFWGKCGSVEELQKQVIDSVKEAGAGEINYEIGTTGLLNYNSIYGGKSFENSYKYDAYMREGDKLAREQILNFLDSGKVPLQVAADRGKEKSVRVNVSMRMNSFYNKTSTMFLNGSMYDKYSAYKQNNSYILSYYYPQYRDYIINVLKEASSFNNVGYVNLDFCRYPNLMGSEATDKEKINIMNDFMRRVRKEIPNKKISVRVPYLNTISYGLDVETWIKEGLINRLIPSSIGYEDFYDINKFVNMVKGTKVELYVGISANLKGQDLTKETEELIKKGLLIPNNEYLTAEDYLVRANEAYNAGASGIFLFNTLTDTDFTKEYSRKFKLLGDKIKVKRWYEFEYPSYLIHDRIEILW